MLKLRGALPVLPLRADQRAEHEGRGQADQRVEEIVDLEGGQKTIAPRSWLKTMAMSYSASNPASPSSAANAS